MSLLFFAAADAAPDNASQLGNIAAGLMMAVFFIKFIQMAFFRKREPKE